MNYNIISEADEGEFIWVIKDQNGNFANCSSIKKTSDMKTKWTYISFKTFSAECRGYTTEKQAEKALEELNKKSCDTGFEIIFHLEYLNEDDLIEQNKARELRGEINMVIYYEIPYNSEITLDKAINY